MTLRVNGIPTQGITIINRPMIMILLRAAMNGCFVVVFFCCDCLAGDFLALLCFALLADCLDTICLSPPPIMVVMVRVSLLYLALIKRSQASRSPSIWQGRQDLNLRHPVLETGALPTELLPYADD